MRSPLNKISIIIPAVNEGAYIEQTIETLYAVEDTRKFEVIIVDDCSTEPINIERKGVKVLRNTEWSGRPISVQRGIDAAKYENIVVFNARMVFHMPWIDEYCKALKEYEMVCATCVYLNADNQVVTDDCTRKYGANVELISKESKIGALKVQWNGTCPENELVNVCLGATTATTKKWWKHIHGLKGLHAWGTADAFISLKTWMAGGRCRVLKNVEIGNIFRSTQHYAYDPAATVYNKMYVIYTLLPMKYHKDAINALKKATGYALALNWAMNTLGQIEKERKYYQSITKKSVINHIKIKQNG
jgi:glycosyltransferase involved in cell wall biosynthesis